jgi:hypothetical protein
MSDHLTELVGIPGDQEFTERVQRLTASEVEQWLGERAANATRIGRQKTDPKDQAGWFETRCFSLRPAQ